MPEQRLHELTPSQVVLAGATPEAFNAFKQSILNSLRPAGELELLFAENLVVAQWGLRRCRLAEASLSTGAHPDPLLDPHALPALRLLDAIIRRHERSVERSLKMLRELQSEREFRRLTVPANEAQASPPSEAATAAAAGAANSSSAAAPLADTAQARRAFFAEQSRKSRLDGANLKAALDRFLHQPPPGGDVAFERFNNK